jgi:hypothetical protein
MALLNSHNPTYVNLFINCLFKDTFYVLDFIAFCSVITLKIHIVMFALLSNTKRKLNFPGMMAVELAALKSTKEKTDFVLYDN